MDYETKADPLDAVFEEAVPAAAVTRPVLSGTRGCADPAKAAFVDGYLRRGSEVELKSFSGVVAADGGYAVPKEIDEVIDATLKAISPIRSDRQCRPRWLGGLSQAGDAKWRNLGMGFGNRNTARNRDADLQRNRPKLWRAIRQSGGDAGDA